VILKRWFLPLLTLCVANAHAQAVNGVILNQQYLDVCSGPHAYLIATLPASNAGTYDHLHLVATFGSNWDSTGNSTINATFANRQSFSYAYTAMGSSPTGNGSHITAYQQNDGTADPNNPYTGGSINLYFMKMFTALRSTHWGQHPQETSFLTQHFPPMRQRTIPILLATSPRMDRSASAR